MYVRITLSNSTSVVPSGCVNDAGETKVTPHENLEGEKKIAVYRALQSRSRNLNLLSLKRMTGC